MKKKKIIIAIAIVIIAIVAAVVIAQFSNNDEPKQTTTTENNEAYSEESATPLTENEIKDLFLKAHELYVEWLSPKAEYLNVDWDKTTTIDGVEYFEVVSNEINSVEELRKEFGKYFSEDIIKENIDRYYVMHNGKMYGNAVLVEGGETAFDSHGLIVKTNSSTECTFTVKSAVEQSYNESEYKLKVINGEWKFVNAFNWITTDESFDFS